MIGLDLAKNIFQVHGVDTAGSVVLRKRLSRGQVEGWFAGLAPAVVGMAACGGAHHWARRLQGLGHEVRLMAPAYVKPYGKRNKTDGRDAEAICARRCAPALVVGAGSQARMQRPSMRFVAVKSAAQQAVLALHRTRELLVPMAANALRAAFAEFGVVAPQGVKGLRELMAQLPAPEAIPEAAHAALASLARHWRALDADIAALERRIVQAVRADRVEPGSGHAASSSRLERAAMIGSPGTSVVGPGSDERSAHPLRASGRRTAPRPDI